MYTDFRSRSFKHLHWRNESSLLWRKIDKSDKKKRERLLDDTWSTAAMEEDCVVGMHVGICPLGQCGRVLRVQVGLTISGVAFRPGACADMQLRVQKGTKNEKTQK